MSSTGDFQKDLEALLPNLRAFARSLTGTTDRADDLVQEALVRAWNFRDRFQPGTNLKAWLFTILRNAHISERRRRKWEVEDVDGEYAGQLSVSGEQTAHMDMLEFEAAFATLPTDQREALLLIGAEGFSYEEAALMCACAVGTMKSRVNRARARLASKLGLADESDATQEPAGASIGLPATSASAR